MRYSRNSRHFLLQLASVPNVTGMVGVLVRILGTVAIFDVADFKGVNSRADGGWPGHDPCNRHCVLMLQILRPTVTGTAWKTVRTAGRRGEI